MTVWHPRDETLLGYPMTGQGNLEVSQIRESRYIIISDRIVTVDGVRRLADVLASTARIDTQGGDHHQLEISIDCVDGSSYSSEDPNLFDDAVVGAKRVTRITMEYWNLTFPIPDFSETARTFLACIS
jgi:hypothetical protein